ncbi:MAG TPA: Hsp33 family molecular chaperone HslO [Rhizomicrobium sp.]|nr:Hsp33 family molecular chaperone HslO [Rhizomicrobium sp.]
MTPRPTYTPAPAADFVLPFDVPGFRGRLVRLDETSARALQAHVLPEGAQRVVAEAVVLAALLGSALKLDGRLSVQTRGDGPLDLVTADYYGAAGGKPIGLRGFARLDETRAAATNAATAPNAAARNAAPRNFAALAGAGSLGITIEPRIELGRGGQAYQGIVALSPEGLAVSAEAYFAQSEQLATALRLAAAPLYVPGKPVRWRAGGLMLQATPELPLREDDWERLRAHIATLEDFELVDTQLSAETLLWRLFHEDEIRVHPAEPLAFRCGCDGGRIAAVLRAYAPAEREGLADADGIVRARCEFCGIVHEIAATALAR